MRRAVLVSPSAAVGGAERSLFSLARALMLRECEVALEVLEPGPLVDEAARLGIPVTAHPGHRTRQLHKARRVIAELADRSQGADVVVSNMARGHVHGGLAARRAGISCVWWQHATHPSRRRPLDLGAAAVPSDLVICPSEGTAVAQRRVTPRRRIEVVHPGVPPTIGTARGSGAAVRSRLGWDGCDVVGIVARLDPWKGHADFLDAAARLVRRRPGVRFLVVGGAHQPHERRHEAALIRRVETLGLGGVVRLVGHQDDAAPWIDAMDVVVHASRGESFGLSIVEAMALERPVVASSAGGPSEIIEHGVSGVLVAPGDASAIAGAVEELLASPPRAAAIGRAAAVRAEHFTEERMTRRLTELIGSVVRDRARATADHS